MSILFWVALNHSSILCDRVELDSELAAALQGRGEGVQVLTPEGEELLDAEAPQGVVAGVTHAVLLAHGHDLVVDMERILG